MKPFFLGTLSQNSLQKVLIRRLRAVLNDPNFIISKTSEIEKRRSSKLFQKVLKLLGALRFRAVIFQTFSDFQICVAPAHKQGRRTPYHKSYSTAEVS